MSLRCSCWLAAVTCVSVAACGGGDAANSGQAAGIDATSDGTISTSDGTISTSDATVSDGTNGDAATGDIAETALDLLAPSCAYWQTNYASSPVFGAARLGDGGFAVVSVGNWAQGQGTGARLRTFDVAGTPGLDVTLSHPAKGKPFAVRARDAGGFVIAGSDVAADGLERLWSLRMDQAGAPLTEDLYGGKDERWRLLNWAQAVDVRADGSIAFGGFKTAKDGTGQAALLHVVDPQGKSVFSKSWPSLPYVGAVASTPSGGVVAWAEKGSDIMPQNNTARLMVFDAQGASLLDNTLLDPWIASTWAIDSHAEGGFVLARAVRPTADNHPHILVQSFDAAGSVAWSWEHPDKPLPGAGPSYARGVVALGAGKLALAGTQDPLTGYLAVLDGKGALVWARIYEEAGATINSELYHALPTADGFFLSGASSLGAWVGHADSCGRLDCAGGPCGP